MDPPQVHNLIDHAIIAEKAAVCGLFGFQSLEHCRKFPTLGKRGELKVNRRHFLKCFSAAAGAAGAAGAYQLTVLGKKAPPPPNIIYMISDDQGWGDVGYYGHPTLQTPHLDAMAAASLRCDRFYAAASVCSPTRAALLTGRSNWRMDITSPLNVGEASIPHSNTPRSKITPRARWIPCSLTHPCPKRLDPL